MLGLSPPSSQQLFDTVGTNTTIRRQEKHRDQYGVKRHKSHASEFVPRHRLRVHSLTLSEKLGTKPLSTEDQGNN